MDEKLVDRSRLVQDAAHLLIDPPFPLERGHHDGDAHAGKARLAAVKTRLGAALAVIVAFVATYLLRLSSGIDNVDDYLYARQTHAYLESLTSSDIGIVTAWKEFAQNSPLVPALATPLSAVDRAASTLVLVQLPLLLGLLAGAAVLLRHLGVSGRTRWVAAVAVTCLPPVLTYTAMLNFALAATTCTVGALAAYLSSDRLRRRRPTLVFGVLLGLLVLSRVVALVYLAALAAGIVVDLLLDRTDVRSRLRNALLGALPAALLAAPWWLTAGPSAWRYLRTAGYGQTVFTHQASLLDRETSRLRTITDETGLLLVGVVVLGVLVALLRPQRAVMLTSGIGLLTLVLLGTSSNAGTAFGLPAVALLSAVAAAGLVRLRPLSLAGAAIALALIVGVFVESTPPTLDRHPLWLSGTPGTAQADAALGCRCIPSELPALNRSVVDLAAGQAVLILRADAVLNPESLRFAGNIDLRGPAGPLDATAVEGIPFVLAGSTGASYLGTDLASAAATLVSLGFEPVLTRQLSPTNSVVLYRRR